MNPARPTGLPSPIPLLHLQEQLGERWSLERELGRGGMGTVWLARDLKLDRPVAIKVLHPHLAADAAHRARFLDEARTAARLAHPHIVPIYGIETTTETAAIVMAFVDGETLAARIARRGALATSEAERVFRELTWALAYAHQCGVIHRDLTLANVLLDRDTGRAVLVDFGLATLATTTDGAPIFGTPGFLAPEVIRGEPATVHTDLYALGVIGYTMLAGRPPLSGETTAELLAKHLVQPPPELRLRGVSRRLIAAVQQCLAKTPDARPADCGALLAALERAPAPIVVAPPLAAWFTRWQRIRPIYAVATPIIGMQSWLLLWGYFQTGIGELVVAAVLSSALAVTALPIVAHGIAELVALRQLQRHGFGIADIRAAWSHWTDALEREYHARGLPPLPGRVVFDLTVLGAAGLAILFLIVFPILPLVVAADELSLTRAVLLSMASSVYLGVLTGTGIGFVAPGIRLKPHGRFRRLMERFWNSSFADGIARLARTGAPARIAATQTLHRNTELVLGLALDELWNALPAGLRLELGDVPTLAGTLQHAAEELRDLGERLAASVEDLADIDPPESRRLDALRVQVQQRQREAITELERLRLHLLRAVAERRATEDLTQQLAAAQELERTLLADLAGHATLRRMLSGTARPTPSPTPSPVAA